MTVQRIESGELATAGPAQNTGVAQASSALRQFAADGAAAMSMALQIAPTPFVPESYKKRGRDDWYTAERIAQNVAAAWLAGDEIGLRPMQALQAIDVIEGRPALNARSMLALVQAAGHEVWTESMPGEAEATQKLAVTIAGRRKGSDHVERVTWTWARARQANLVDKKNWQRSPIDMLVARATSAVCRRIASDVLMGLAYSVEELDDEAGEPVEPQTVRVQRGAAARRRQPEADAWQEPDEPEGATPDAAVSVPDAESVPVPAEDAAGDSEAAPEGEGDVVECGVPKPDGSAVCNRPQGHEGRHHYGAPAPQRVLNPEQTAALDEHTEAVQQLADGGEAPRPAVSEFTPSDEERAGQDDEGLGEPFSEPTEEELAEAYEAERAARAAAAERAVAADAAALEREAAAERDGGLALPVEHPAAPVDAAAQQPAQPAAAPAADDAGDDDPWADFR